MVRILLAFLLCTLVIGQTVNAQVQTPRYVSMTKNTKGYYEYLPQGYNPSGTKTYPLLIFIHGIGEKGKGTPGQLPKVLYNGPPKLINNHTFPTSFTVNGQSFGFIVISPQFVDWPSGGDINKIIDFCLSNYKVDPTRIYLTGLSMGGGAVWEFAGNKDNSYIKKLAAIVPISGASYPSMERAKAIAKANLPVWAFHNLHDPTVTVTNTINYVDEINSLKPNPAARKTIFQANGHDAWSRAYDPNYREGGKNIYEWMLTYSQGNAPIPVPNQAPVANAGTDKTITLPANSVSLSGSGTDADGSISSYSWSQTSGPSTSKISNASSASTTVSNLSQGTYVFRLTVIDNDGAASTDDVTVIVNPASNKAPTADAGNNQTITLPVNTVRLRGSGADADGKIVSYNWQRVSGPTQFTINNSSSATTDVSNLTQGIYVFQLTVKDNGGLTASANVTIKVNPAPVVNKAPTANAGADQTITLPNNSVTFNGSGTDQDGSISSYLWTQVSGPSAANIKNSANANATVKNLVEGTYTFRLTVTDNDGSSATDDLVIKVNASNSTGGGQSGPPVPDVTRYIKVNVYGGGDSYNDKTWNNWNVGTQSGSNIISSSLIYSDGTVSSVKTTLSDSYATVDNGDGYVDAIAPGKVLRSTSYSTGDRTLTFTGLSASKKYDLELYASRSTNKGNSTTFSIGSLKATVVTYYNLTKKAQFRGVTPDAQGRLVVNIKKGSTYNYINGFILTEGSSATAANVALVSTDATQQNNTAERGLGATAATGISLEESQPNAKAGLNIFPNPVQDRLTVSVNNEHTGTMKLQVVDVNGVVRKQISMAREHAGSFQTSLSVADLPKGTYVVRVQIGSWTESIMLAKQ